jgi:Lon protease-like protein
LPPIRGYRKIEADWIEEPTTPVVLNRKRLMPALKRYLSSCCPDSDWQAIAASQDEKLAVCLAMICPLSPTEQQALLEAACGQSRADMLTNLIEIASHGPCGPVQ